MKSVIYKQNKTRIRDRVKEAFVNTLKVSKDFYHKKTKVAAILIVAIIVLEHLSLILQVFQWAGFLILQVVFLQLHTYLLQIY